MDWLSMLRIITPCIYIYIKIVSISKSFKRRTLIAGLELV
jgi:hypothetical protein